MSIRVRLGNPVEDQEQIIAGLRNHLNPLTDKQRYDWLYRQNPDGPARIWVIEDEQSGRIVGSSGLLPRLFYIDGKEVTGCVVADTWVHPDHRVLGPAVKLQRACIADIMSGTFRLGYDFPRQAMPAVYGRIRIAPCDTLTDFVRLLRFNSYLDNRFGGSPIVDLSARALNAIGRLLTRPRSVRNLTLNFESRVCGPEFTPFHRRVAGKSICVARTTEYLNWRYIGHFHKRHEIFTARRGGELAGYAVVQPDTPRAAIIDVVCENDDAVRLGLLSSLLSALAERCCDTASFSTLDSSGTTGTLRQLHFRRQSSAPFVMIHSADDSDITHGTLGEFTIGQEAD
jgi:hypothetical protein